MIPTCLRLAMGVVLACIVAARSAPAANEPDLSWLAGHWCSRTAEATSEELWLPESGGLMLGLNRTTAAGEVSFEFLRIEISGDHIEFVGQPNGAAPTRFALAGHGPASASFENPSHDYPKRIRYRIEGGELVAAIDGGPSDDNPLSFRWSRCNSTAQGHGAA